MAFRGLLVRLRIPIFEHCGDGRTEDPAIDIQANIKGPAGVEGVRSGQAVTSQIMP